MSAQLTNRITPSNADGNGHAVTNAHAPANTSHDEVELVPVPRPPRAGFFKLLLVAVPIMAMFGGLFLSGWLPLTRREQALASEAQERKDAPTRVAIITPKRGAATTDLVLPGDVQPVQETNLYAHIDGYLKKWHVDIGDDVKAGQLLAEIDTPEVDQQLNQAIAHLAEGHANLALAEADLKRMTDIGGSAIAKQELDDAEAKVNTARATLGVDEANVRSLQSQQAYQKVIAPFGGTITTRNTEVGQLVTNGNGNGQILFHLARTDPVRVFIDVPQTYAPAVKPGQRAQLLIREYAGRTFEGRVTRTARAVDIASRTLRTEIEVPNKDGALIVGMYAKVKLSVTPPGDATLLIPGSALVINGGGTQVALVRDGKVHFQPVELDADQGAQVGVRAGLAEADQVIATPGERLTEGAAVTIAVPADTQPARP